MLPPIGNVRLIGGHTPYTHLRQPHHHFQHIHVTDDVGQLGRRTTTDQSRNVSARHVDIRQHAGVFSRLYRHRLFSHIEIKRVRHDEQIQRIEVCTGLAIQFNDDPVIDRYAGLRIVRAVGDNQTGLGPRLDKGLLVDIAFCQQFKPYGTFHCAVSTVVCA